MIRNKFNRLILVAAAPAVLLFCGQSGFAQGGEAEVTYAKDVAPIFQAKCQVCHQPNSVAPM
jgi:mono/diheme cytochrome c family protein